MTVQTGHETALVSIITPLHNAATYIADTISSVLAQSYQDWEMIIVDDVSDDDSVKIVERFAEKDARIKLIRLSENSGAAVARNTAIEAARGRYIAFLDSDDLWYTDKLKRQLAFMQQTGCPLTYAAYDKIDEQGNMLGRVGVPEKVNYSDMLKTCYFGCLTVMYDSDYFGKVGMPLIRKRQDYGLWLKLLKKTNYAQGMNASLGQYRVHGQSISSNKINTATYTWRLFRYIEGLPFFKSVYYFGHYAIRGLLRNRFPALARKLGVLR